MRKNGKRTRQAMVSLTRIQRGKKRDGMAILRFGSRSFGRGRSTSAALESREETNKRWYAVSFCLRSVTLALDVVNRSTSLS